MAKDKANVSFPRDLHQRLMIRKIKEGRDQMDILGDAFEIYDQVEPEALPALRAAAKAIAEADPEFRQRLVSALATAELAKVIPMPGKKRRA